MSVIITDFFILFPLGAMSSFVARELFPKPVEGGSVLAMDILAKKFREQSLEESANQNASQIKFIRPGDGFKLSRNAEAKLAGADKKVYTLQLNPDETNKVLGGFPQGDYPDNLREQSLCDKNFNSQVDPPSKRHCRSLSVPPDKMCPQRWQPQETRVWRPIAVISNEKELSSSNPSHVNSSESQHTDNAHCQQTSNFISIVPRNFHYEPGGCSSHGFHIPPDIFTPPESPVPRPSSASTCSGRQDASSYQKFHAFDNRSLSYEDQISSSSSAGSTPSVPLFIGSAQSSPQRHRIPRCRSQPSVLHDRKYGVKRRRDHDQRPSLNFLKMTEKRVSRFHEELESVMSLMPIASSPLDNDVPLSRAMESTTSPISEMEQGRTSSVEFLDRDPNDLEEEEDGPVKLLGDHGEVEEIFPLQEDLDLEQIETN